jgi:hypothetical protein
VTGDLHVGGHRARCDGQSRCVIPIRQPLEPDRRYEVDPSGLRDREGLAPRGRPSFRTGRSLDDRPPELGPTACAATEVVLGPGCAAVRDVSVTIRLHTDEPATAFVEGDGARVAGDEAAEDHRLRLEGLEPDRAVTLAIGATDAAGNEACARGLELRTLPALLPVVVTEVYADAAGPEPAQEFVEVLNVGTRDVSLDGLVVVDGGGPGDPVAAGATLAAGRYGLLVSDRFDATSAADPRLAPGTPLFRVGASLGTNGLLNAGEPVAIVDADGHELSRWPAFSAPRSGVSIQRVSPEADEGDPASWREDAEVGATPGAPSSTSAP